MLEEDTVKDNVCFALSRCDLVTQRCEQCTAGKKVIIIYPLSYIIILMCIMIGIYLIIRKPKSVSIAFLLIKHFMFQREKTGAGLSAEEARIKAESIIKAEKRKRFLNREKNDL